jgi:hypothetical protein
MCHFVSQLRLELRQLGRLLFLATLVEEIFAKDRGDGAFRGRNRFDFRRVTKGDTDRGLTLFCFELQSQLFTVRGQCQSVHMRA